MMKIKERGMKIRMERYGADQEPEFKPEFRSIYNSENLYYILYKYIFFY